MGIKRFFSRFLRRFRPVKCEDAVIDAVDPNSPQALSKAVSGNSTSTIQSANPLITVVGPDHTSKELVLWKPPIRSVPSIAPIFPAVKSPLPLLVSPIRNTTAHPFAFPGIVTMQSLIRRMLVLPFLYDDRLVRDGINRFLPVLSNVSVASQYTVGAPEVGNQGGRGYLQENGSSSIQSCHCAPEVRYSCAQPAFAHLAPKQALPVVSDERCPDVREFRYLCVDPSVAHLAPKQIVPRNVHEPHRQISPATDALSLVKNTRTGKTLLVDTLKIPCCSFVSENIPRYPPGLGFKEVDDIVQLGSAKERATYRYVPLNKPTRALVPTQRFCADEHSPELPHLEMFNAFPSPRGDLRGDGKWGGGESGNDPERFLTVDVRRDKYTITTNTICLQAGLCLYRLSRTIGRGGNGVVWFGQGLRRNGPPMDVAVKVINRQQFFSGFVSDEQLRDMSTAKGKQILDDLSFEAGDYISVEFSAWLRATYEDHPFLTPLIDCFSDEKNFYFVMRYYPETLRQRAENRACGLQLWQIRLIAAELSLAIEKLHDMHFVHHDLKLENVLVTPNGHVAVCDFGNVVTFPTNLTEEQWNGETMHGRAGTCGYLSPEQYLGSGGHNYKTDIYGFGLMILDLFMPRGNPWYTFVPGVEIEDEDTDFFMDQQPDPRHDAVMARVYDNLARDFLLQILEPDPAKRPGWKEIKRHPFFTKYLDWGRVLTRDYDPCYRACGRKRKIVPITRPTYWVRQRRDTTAANRI